MQNMTGLQLALRIRTLTQHYLKTPEAKQWVDQYNATREANEHIEFRKDEHWSTEAIDLGDRVIKAVQRFETKKAAARNAGDQGAEIQTANAELKQELLDLLNMYGQHIRYHDTIYGRRSMLAFELLDLAHKADGRDDADRYPDVSDSHPKSKGEEKDPILPEALYDFVEQKHLQEYVLGAQAHPHMQNLADIAHRAVINPTAGDALPLGEGPDAVNTALHGDHLALKNRMDAAIPGTLEQQITARDQALPQAVANLEAAKKAELTSPSFLALQAAQQKLERNKHYKKYEAAKKAYETAVAARDAAQREQNETTTNLCGQGGNEQHPIPDSIAQRYGAATDELRNARLALYGNDGTPNAPADGSLQFQYNEAAARVDETKEALGLDNEGAPLESRDGVSANERLYQADQAVRVKTGELTDARRQLASAQRARAERLQAVGREIAAVQRDIEALQEQQAKVVKYLKDDKLIKVVKHFKVDVKNEADVITKYQGENALRELAAQYHVENASDEDVEAIKTALQVKLVAERQRLAAEIGAKQDEKGPKETEQAKLQKFDGDDKHPLVQAMLEKQEAVTRIAEELGVVAEKAAPEAPEQELDEDEDRDDYYSRLHAAEEAQQRAQQAYDEAVAALGAIDITAATERLTQAKNALYGEVDPATRHRDGGLEKEYADARARLERANRILAGEEVLAIEHQPRIDADEHGQNGQAYVAKVAGHRAIDFDQVITNAQIALYGANQDSSAALDADTDYAALAPQQEKQPKKRDANRPDFDARKAHIRRLEKSAPYYHVKADVEAVQAARDAHYGNPNALPAPIAPSPAHHSVLEAQAVLQYARRLDTAVNTTLEASAVDQVQDDEGHDVVLMVSVRDRAICALMDRDLNRYLTDTLRQHTISGNVYNHDIGLMARSLDNKTARIGNSNLAEVDHRLNKHERTDDTRRRANGLRVSVEKGDNERRQVPQSAAEHFALMRNRSFTTPGRSNLAYATQPNKGWVWTTEENQLLTGNNDLNHTHGFFEPKVDSGKPASKAPHAPAHEWGVRKIR